MCESPMPAGALDPPKIGGDEAEEEKEEKIITLDEILERWEKRKLKLITRCKLFQDHYDNEIKLIEQEHKKKYHIAAPVVKEEVKVVEPI